MSGIVWGFSGETMEKSWIRIVRYSDDSEKDLAITKFETSGFWEVDWSSDDDLEMDFQDLVSE